jgi:hypothetical protein
MLGDGPVTVLTFNQHFKGNINEVLRSKLKKAVATRAIVPSEVPEVMGRALGYIFMSLQSQLLAAFAQLLQRTEAAASSLPPFNSERLSTLIFLLLSRSLSHCAFASIE